MIFEHVTTGGCQSYLIGCGETCAAAVIDPEISQLDRYEALAARSGVRIRYVIDSHTHADHFTATRQLARHLGVPVGGGADRAALTLGNALVGNTPDTVAVEVTLSGPTVEALHPAACVVFGTPFQTTVNGHPIATGTTFTLEPGDVLRIGGTLTGVRGYLCVAGGFDAPEVLGSRSALGPLRAGDELTCRASRTEARSLPARP